ncbi:MAG TPA: hypothetical protein VHR47_05720 [Bacillota bacterium]|nr:hypothetical protein [Bacillota bacterium]
MEKIICYLKQIARTIMIVLVVLVLLRCLVYPNTFDVLILVGLLIVLMSWICNK